MTLAFQIEKRQMQGFTSLVSGWRVPSPMNAHVHLRDPLAQPDLFALAVRETARIYDFATAMPNLGKNRIRTVEQALAYRARCKEAGCKYNPRFDVTTPLYLEPDTEAMTVHVGYSSKAWRTAKLYPKAGTTGSDEGVDFRNISSILPALQAMEERGMILLVHGEVVLNENNELIADRKREVTAVIVIGEILARFPKLAVVFEHISSRDAITAVQRWKRYCYNVEATVAPQYLFWNSTVLYAGGMNPVYYSIPILKDEEDRLALIDFVVKGGGMLGTDSAPHVITSKSRPRGCPGGVFNEPVGFFAYFHIFRTYGGEDWFEKFVNFSSFKARHLYGLPAPESEIIIREENAWEVPFAYRNGGAEVIPMFAGMTIPYSFEQVT